MEQLYKIGKIIANELYGIYTDRNAMLIMIAAPLALATIIGLAFSGFSDGSVGFDPIPVVIVNEDEPTPLDSRQMGDSTSAGAVAGEELAVGARFVTILVPSTDATAEQIADNELWRLINASVLTDTAAAYASVESGKSVAALIIPPDFSKNMMGSNVLGFELPAQTSDAPAQVGATLYVDPSKSDLADIVESIVNAIGSQMMASAASTEVAIGTFFQFSAENPSVGASLQEELRGKLTAGAIPFEELLATEEAAIPISRETERGDALSFNPFVYFGTNQTIFFMLFTAMATSAEFLRDKRNGILARLMATPTPISTIIIGKIGAAIVTCALQVLVLLSALLLINAAAAREFTMIFGTNILGLLLVIAAVATAAAGLAMAVASLARSPEQAQAINGLVAMGMGLAGGAFFNLESIGAARLISRFTVNYWAVDAIVSLASGDNAIYLNVAVLLAIGAVALAIAFTRFRRTLEA